MAVLEVRPHVSGQELQNSSQKQENPSYLRKRSKGRKVLASAVLIAALSVGVKAGADESFTQQTVTAKQISASETAQLRVDLTKTLAEKGLLGDKEKPLPIEIITLNTASGNTDIEKPQEDFVKLPFYQKVIHGASDAPIVGLQEAGPAQVEELKKYKKSGNFSYLYIKSRFSDGGNLLVIPKRFTILESKSEPYSWTTQGKGIVDFVKEEGIDWSKKWWSQTWPRVFSEAKLHDSLSGKEFTVFNTHMSYEKGIQDAQAKELFGEIAKAEKNSPVVLIGDLNANIYLENERGKMLKKNVAKLGLSDMGQEDGSRGGGKIDYVLAKGFTPIKQEYVLYSGSDHDAEANTIQFQR